MSKNPKSYQVKFPPKEESGENPKEKEFLPEDLRILTEVSESTVESEGIELVSPAGVKEFANDEIGEVVGASTTGGIQIKMIREPETLRVGTPLIVEGGQLHFYSLVTDINYPGNNIAVAFANSPMAGLLPVKEVPGVRGSPFFSLANLNCLQIIEPTKDEAGNDVIVQRTYDTIPRLLSKARLAKQEDLELVFKGSATSGAVGGLNGIEELQVPLDFAELIKVPFGIFGSTGSGKSVFTKILASWIIRLDLASLIIFDVMGEYTWESQEKDTPGLAAIFGDQKVVTMAMDPAKAPTGAEPFFLYKEKVTDGDLLTALSDQGLTVPQRNSIEIFYDTMKRARSGGTPLNIIDYILDANEDTRPQEVHKTTLPALKNRIKRFKKLKFLREEDPKTKDSIDRILQLLKEGKTVVLNFGSYAEDKANYMFVANLVTRRVRKEFQERGKQYHKTVILLEEAHKFLDREVARHSIFGKIAREMRKYGLTIGFVDQRPSEIMTEVFSQLANRFILRLSDPKDIDAALSGVGEASLWRGILRGLPKWQVVAMGTSITVPSILLPWKFTLKNAKEKLNVSETASEVKDKITDDDIKDI
ncbi:MAG: hypothetical protein RBG13Loki_1985 [Promethearchaeota archaeon CR_4]|nr:MAG: hypothetical protein RBG13Loki_1985 [Candidatus Lokiarchaeota archaeon CR_4]